MEVKLPLVFSLALQGNSLDLRPRPVTDVRIYKLDFSPKSLQPLTFILSPLTSATRNSNVCNVATRNSQSNCLSYVNASSPHTF
jgi:hypothetical protein